MITFEQYIRDSVVTREEIDIFLDPTAPSWAQFDAELGYTLGNSMPRDGIDASSTISTVQKNGARAAQLYADKPCRINTYGNSFTLCQQVNNEETWQEYLAGHLGEPARNFGMGGYGFYQAYRRMIRTEKTADGADYIILYIWGHDYYRSLLRCRHVQTYRHWGSADKRMFAGNFWSHLEMDLDSGQLIEKDSLLPTPEALCKMTDADFMVEAVQDDLMLQMMTFCNGDIRDPDWERLRVLSGILESPLDLDDAEKRLRSVARLRDAYAFAATKYTLRQAYDYTRENGKQLMIALFCPRATRELIETGRRYDQEIVDFLEQHSIRYFDMNRVHVEDYKDFNLSVDEYFQRYLFGHYKPVGNHLFAYAIKDSVVDWLNPKPITYQNQEAAVISFEGYLG